MTTTPTDEHPVVHEELSRPLRDRVDEDELPRLVALGANKSGKTLALRAVCSASRTRPVAYWSLAEFPPNDERAVVSRLCDVFRVPEIAADPEDALWHILKSLPPGGNAVLVLDHWDEALESGVGAVDIVKTVTSACLSDSLVGPDGQMMGLVVASRFPSTGLFAAYSSVLNAPGLVRLSTMIRQFDVQVMPWLTPETCLSYLADRAPDLAVDDAQRLTRDCGGWLGLLHGAASAARERGSWDSAARRYVSQRSLKPLLEKTLLSSVKTANELPSLRSARAWVLQALHEQIWTPVEFGLPVDVDDPEQLAPLVRDFLEEDVQ